MSAPNLQHAQAVMATNVSDQATALPSTGTCSFPSLQEWPSALAQAYKPEAVLAGFLMASLLQFLVCLGGWCFKGLRPFSRTHTVRDASSAEKMEGGECDECLQDEKAEGALDGDDGKEPRPKYKHIACYGRDEAIIQIIGQTSTFAQFSSEQVGECSASVGFRFSTMLAFLATGYAFLKLMDYLHFDWFGRLPTALRADCDEDANENEADLDREHEKIPRSTANIEGAVAIAVDSIDVS